VFAATVSIFLLGYILALALELSRLYARFPGRVAWIMLLAGGGWILHGIYLAKRMLTGGAGISLPESGSEWLFVAGWIFVASYLFLTVRRPTNLFGPFLLPVVLAITLSGIVLDIPPEAPGQTNTIEASSLVWRLIHSFALLLGTVAVSLGLSTGLMSWIQEYRLKTKRTLVKELRLPSLEYLHNLGRNALVVSTMAISAGLVSGVVLNLQRNGVVNWLESGIVFCGGLLIWLIVASILEWQAQRRGTSWSPQLNAVSFAIVLVALILVFSTPHGRLRPVTFEANEVQGSGGGTT
jgi:ABC-type uncharacterized transport system permease subunit